MSISTMMNEVLDYPAEERAEWLKTAGRRRRELLSGAVRAIPVEAILAELRRVRPSVHSRFHAHAPQTRLLGLPPPK